ncbi:hypothetical protein [Nonomuraea sp. NPDC049400]|uniref:hypothetical protein n=1 Tax=Nonomuraea sp. NPDC049400 TaxID=3364352 RepID=UPI0037922939
MKPHTDVGSGVVTVDKRLYLTEDDRLVEEGNPDGRWLWCTPGMPIPREQAQHYGLLDEPEPEVAAESEQEEEQPPAQPKRRVPAANKARTRATDK